MMALSQWPQLLPAPTRQPRHLGPARAPTRKWKMLPRAGAFKAQNILKSFRPFPAPGAVSRPPSRGSGSAPRPRQGRAGATPGGRAAVARRRRPSPPAGRPARRPSRPAYPGTSPQIVPPAARLSPPACPRSSCSSRCSHALPSSQFLTSWSHPPRCNRTALCRATGGREGRGGELRAERRQPPERPRRSHASLARRKPGAAGRGGRGGAAGGGRRQPRSAAPGSASAGSERAASVRRVQLS